MENQRVTIKVVASEVWGQQPGFPQVGERALSPATGGKGFPTQWGEPILEGASSTTKESPSFHSLKCGDNLHHLKLTPIHRLSAIKGDSPIPIECVPPNKTRLKPTSTYVREWAKEKFPLLYI